MNAANPLVADRVDSTTWYTGLGLVEDVNDTINGFSEGSWIEGSIGGVAASLDALGLVVDPIGSLVSWGVSWLMEHVKPLSDALDWLAGDPDQINAYAQTWDNISKSVGGQATALRDSITRDITDWRNTAADAYRAFAHEQADLLEALQRATGGLSMIVSGAGLLVALVREIVRDLIADFVSVLAVRLWEWLAEVAGTLGVATPWVIAQVGQLVAKWAAKIAKVVEALIKSIRKLKPILSKLDELIKTIKQALLKLARSRPGNGPDTPGGGHNFDWEESPRGLGDPPDLPTDRELMDAVRATDPQLIDKSKYNSNDGHYYADRVIAGGRPDGQTVFAGHGYLERGAGETVVPPGTYISFYVPDGSSLPGPGGLAVERGVYPGMALQTFGPGDVIPNYTLSPPAARGPGGFSVYENSTTVPGRTPLSDLLKPGMGHTHWAACRDAQL